jgi:hypothetical protein
LSKPCAWRPPTPRRPDAHRHEPYGHSPVRHAADRGGTPAQPQVPDVSEARRARARAPWHCRLVVQRQRRPVWVSSISRLTRPRSASGLPALLARGAPAPPSAPTRLRWNTTPVTATGRLASSSTPALPDRSRRCASGWRPSMSAPVLAVLRVPTLVIHRQGDRSLPAAPAVPPAISERRRRARFVCRTRPARRYWSRACPKYISSQIASSL